MDVVQAKISNGVRKLGYHILKVKRTETAPPWAYSIGLFRNYKHPEIVVFGLDSEVSEQLVKLLSENVKNGKKYEAGKTYQNLLEGVECYFLEVNKKWYPHFLGFARWFYTNDSFSTIQCVWPDQEGYYPWQRQFNKEWRMLQPLIGDKVGQY